MFKFEQISFKVPPNPTKFDDQPLVIHSRTSAPSKHLIILIHGVRGYRYGYWGNLPDFLMDDFETSDLGLYYYRTAFKRISLFKSIDIDGEARVLADTLRQLAPYAAVTLVAHSMGGILAKAAIVDLMDRRHRSTVQLITGLILLACPQIGSTRVPRFLKIFSKDARALFPHNGTLHRIDATLNARLTMSHKEIPDDRHKIPTWAIIAAEDFWVDPLSASIGIPEEQKMTFRGSHGSIVRPNSKDQTPYVFLRTCVENSLMSPYRITDDGEEMLIEDASPDDVGNVRNLAVGFFGEGVTPEDALVSFAREGGVLKVVKRIIRTGSETRERFSGYFTVIPLTADATSDVKNGVLPGRSITIDHMARPPKKTASLYVGAVAATDRYSRAIVLEALRLHVDYSMKMGVPEVLTRPITDDGLRLVRRYKFRALSTTGLNQIYILGGRSSMKKDRSPELLQLSSTRRAHHVIRF